MPRRTGGLLLSNGGGDRVSLVDQPAAAASGMAIASSAAVTHRNIEKSSAEYLKPHVSVVAA